MNVRGVAVRAVIPAIPMVPPFVVMFPPMLIAVALELVLVAKKFPSAVFEPTLEGRVMVPEPEARVSACEPAVVALTVEEKVMDAPALDPLVVFNVALCVKETIPVIPIVPPLVIMFPPTLMAVVLELVLANEMFPSAVFEPMFAERVIVPDPDAKVRPADPIVAASIVLLKVIFWPVFVIVGVVPVKTTGSGNV